MNFNVKMNFNILYDCNCEKSVLNQYRFQCWHGTDLQYRASTDGQLPAKLPFGAAPVLGRRYVFKFERMAQTGSMLLPVINSCETFAFNPLMLLIVSTWVCLTRKL